MSLITNAEQYIAKIIFRNRILIYKGQQYEDFFVSIMTKHNPKFKAVKAYGNIGDRKNDGFDSATGTYYQVFSPEDITKSKTINDAVIKLEMDFVGLYNNWNDICPIKHFFYVVNDRYEGLPAPIMQKILELNSNPVYADVDIECFLVKDLERIFDSLDECAKQDVVGYIPDEPLPVIEYEALYQTVSYLLKVELPGNFSDTLVVPNFDDKIIFNGLSECINHQLVTASYQEGTLIKYFNDNPGIKEALQKKFHALYEQSKAHISGDEENYSDRRFYNVIEKACPRNTVSMRSCVLVLMAYYFSSCDIFEEPPINQREGGEQ